MNLDHEGVVGRLDGPQHVAAQDGADLDKATLRAQALPHVAAKRLLDAGHDVGGDGLGGGLAGHSEVMGPLPPRVNR
mgnify:FL=1